MFGFGLPETTDIREPHMRGLEEFEAAQRLKEEIFTGIKDYLLTNGSHVGSILLNTLDVQQRHWIFEELDGQLFEPHVTHVQYKVVWDQDMDELYVLEVDQPLTHNCIRRKKTKKS